VELVPRSAPAKDVTEGAARTASATACWGSPCPPEGKGPHRCVFALYELDKPLRLGAGASADEVPSAVAGAALARGTLSASYLR
jgi:phosphatidylethanolamine-binding protein (PEBP) family uncharacterized protein